MNAYESNVDLDAAAQHIIEAEHLVLATHAKPDADAYGSTLALARALQTLGKSGDAWLMPPVPANLRALIGSELLRWHEPESDLGNPDLVVVLDTGAWSQVLPMRSFLEQKANRMLIIDHHLSGDIPAAWRHINGKAAACCELVAMLLPKLDPNTDLLADPVVRDALFVGLAGDTGWFRFSNTRERSHLIAAQLLAHGVDHARLYRQLQQTERPQKLKLMARALQNLEWLADKRVALLVLSATDFAESNALVEETEHIVDLPQMVEAVEVVALVTEAPAAKVGEPIRLSFRSKPGPNAIDVSALANRFGGGGHARAAGARLPGPLDRALKSVREALVTAVVSATKNGQAI